MITKQYIKSVVLTNCLGNISNPVISSVFAFESFDRLRADSILKSGISNERVSCETRCVIYVNNKNVIF